jgi:hypothetical protein
MIDIDQILYGGHYRFQSPIAQKTAVEVSAACKTTNLTSISFCLASYSLPLTNSEYFGQLFFPVCSWNVHQLMMGQRMTHRPEYSVQFGPLS